uniref:Uncharacterized protein n=1 Tax=Cacopsylla melanoneura TaxID=428564 RepID=A0A8D8QYQ2_9HEMI
MCSNKLLSTYEKILTGFAKTHYSEENMIFLTHVLPREMNRLVSTQTVDYEQKSCNQAIIKSIIYLKAVISQSQTTDLSFSARSSSSRPSSSEEMVLTRNWSCL